MSDSNVIYYDFETTGLNPFHEKIIDYCFINENTDEKLESLVNPEQPLPSKMTEITGISDEQLQFQEPIVQHIDSFRKFFSEDKVFFLVAHNGDGFDKHFLNELNREFGIFKNKEKIKYLDTLLIAKKFIPDQYSFKLASLCKRFGITPGSHRAFSDTFALQKLYKHMLRIIETKTEYSYEYLYNNPNVVYNLIY